MSETITIIDGYGFIFRAFFATPLMNNSSGLPTNALFVFAKMLIRLQKILKTDYVCMVFDPGGKTFRHEIYPEYKSHRPPIPEELKLQMPYFPRLVDALGIPLYSQSSFEADDVIATLARKASEQGMEVYIATGDKDMCQLVSDEKKIRLIDTMANPPKFTDNAKVIEKFGVEPRLVPQVQALCGDTADNIPGAKGIGIKTAAKLIQDFGSVEGIYEKIDTITAKARKASLEEFRDLAADSLKLVTLRDDLDIELRKVPFDLNANRDDLVSLLSELEFRSLLSEIGESFKAVPEKKSAKSTGLLNFDAEEVPVKHPSEEKIKILPPFGALEGKAILIDDQESLDRFSGEIKDEKILGLSLCNLKDAPIGAYTAGIGVSTPQKRFYVTFRHKDLRHMRQCDASKLKDMIETLAGDSERVIVTDDAKDFYQRCLDRNIDVKAKLFDTAIADFLLTNTSEKPSALPMLTRYFGIEGGKYAELSLELLEPKDIAGISVDNAASLYATRAAVSLLLHKELSERMASHQVFKLFEDVEMPLCKVLAEMEFRGVMVDAEALRVLDKAFEKRYLEIKKEAEVYADGDFNIASPKQVGELLYGKLGLVAKRKKKTVHGQSTDHDTLESMKEQHPVVELILEYRQLAKLSSSYTQTLPHLVDPTDGRIHGRFNQCVTATGRLSSKEPNLQNIPTRNELGLSIRRCFVAPEGRKLVRADYSQIELRIMAALSREPLLIRAFKEGRDIHAATAAAIFEVESVDARQRNMGKTINFGVLYGMGAQKMSKETGISLAEAKKFIDLYHKRFPLLERYFVKLVEDARTLGYATTLLGRKRPLPELDSMNGMYRSQAERMAVNTPIQGTAADIIKLAMIKLSERLKKEDLDAVLIIQVHDELVLECSEKDAERCAAILKEEMEKAFALPDVELKVEVSVGDDWGALK